MPIYFDATFSWSGYSYQGKVGMFIVLKKLNEYRGNNIEIEFNNWTLEFEWLEDFSIKQNGRYLSLHQVKTLASTYINSYNVAIQQTIDNSNILGYPITPHFHVSSNVTNPHNIFYQYTINRNNQQYCPLDEIDNLVKKEIRLFLQLHNISDYNGGCEDSHFFKLLAIIDEHVRIRHQNIQNNPPATRIMETISFSEIINSLKTDSRQFTNERMISEKKAYLSSSLDKFLQNKDENIKYKLKKFVRESFDLGFNFVKYAKSISPHIHAIYNDEVTIANFQDLLNAESLKCVFFKIIEKIEKGYLWQGHKIIYEKLVEEKDKKFLPTTINRNQDDCDEVSTDILRNPYAVEDLYEMDYFITDRISCKSIEEEANNYTEIRDEDLPNVENKQYKIYELKRVEMIKRIDAERILNA